LLSLLLLLLLPRGRGVEVVVGVVPQIAEASESTRPGRRDWRSTGG
jgi:hypothetical protein